MKVSGPRCQGATLEFDELSARQVRADEVPWQVSPAEAGLEKITLGAEIVDQPLALAGNSMLGLFCSGLVIRNDDLNMSAKFVHGDSSRCRSEWMGRSTYRHHLRLAQPGALYGLRVHLGHVPDRDGQGAHPFQHQVLAALHRRDSQVDRCRAELRLQQP